MYYQKLCCTPPFLQSFNIDILDTVLNCFISLFPVLNFYFYSYLSIKICLSIYLSRYIKTEIKIDEENSTEHKNLLLFFKYIYAGFCTFFLYFTYYSISHIIFPIKESFFFFVLQIFVLHYRNSKPECLF